jgi:uncharacterized membrane protein YidH (DUF202 family)
MFIDTFFYYKKMKRERKRKKENEREQNIKMYLEYQLLILDTCFIVLVFINKIKMSVKIYIRKSN